MLQLIRANLWWNTIVPQVLGWVYFSLLIVYGGFYGVFGGCIAVPRFDESIYALFFIALIGISTFGYLLNDCSDTESDTIAGKVNLLSAYSQWIKLLIVVVPLFVGSFAWILMQLELGNNLFHYSNVLFATQILLLIAYSIPPVRLKERSEWGIVADAAYGHLNPVFITLSIFFPFNYNRVWVFYFLCCLFGVCGFKGLRNILLHQLMDRKSDAKANICTAVLKYGPMRIVGFVNDFLLPGEFVFLLLLVLLISYRFPPFIISILLFSVISYLKFSGWKLNDLPKRQLKFKFLHFLNDYYEGWMPLFFLILLSTIDSWFLFLFILHLLFFPNFILKLWKDFKTIQENFKTEEDY